MLAGGNLREPEQFFEEVTQPRVRAAWRAWARAHLPETTIYCTTGHNEAVLDLLDIGFTELAATGLPLHQQKAFMDLLGVQVARAQQREHYARNRNKTTWVPQRSLTAAERGTLEAATQLINQAIGPFALARVRVYSKSEENPCTEGFYLPPSGDVAVHRDTLAHRHRLHGALVHEAAHRVGHRGGGRWVPIPDYGDRSHGFEQLLTEFLALLLGYLADGGSLPDPVPAAEQPATGRDRRAGPDRAGTAPARP